MTSLNLMFGKDAALMVLGVDPGLNGALALRFENDIEIFDIPTHQITVNRKKKQQIDLYAFANWIDIHRNTIKYAIIENPHSMPGQGVSSSFNFGFTCGVAQAMIASALIPIHLVRPVTWKKQLGLSKDKDACRLRASERFPKYSELWQLVKHDGRAEATLLTLYTPETPFF
jgi:crossover junction endodeoxyribonuclease RuvC